MYLYRGMRSPSLNQNIIDTLSPGKAGVMSQGSSTSRPGTPQTTLAGTENKQKQLTKFRLF